MSARKGKKGQFYKGQAKSSSRRQRLSIWVLVVVLVGAAAVILLWPRKAARESSTPAEEPALTAETRPEFQRLLGRWLRPDGGYILEIRSADSMGRLDVAYLNPRPINVSRAEASREGTATKVFVELRDEGYPGSTYTLVYDSQRDVLIGIYYQAQMGQKFDVVFVRVKTP
jgi:hypothetical protein